MLPHCNITNLHDITHGHIILTKGQSVFGIWLTSMYFILVKGVATINFQVFEFLLLCTDLPVLIYTILCDYT